MDPLSLLARWGVTLVFGTVLIEQAGLPLPAAPLLVAAGALAQEGVMRPEHLLLAAFAACLIADHAWFLAGRLRGRQVLAGICRISLSPDTCVRRTDDLIRRHGAVILLFAKFVPGVSAVSIPTAAAAGLGYGRFLLFDTIGCLAWCGVYVGLGMIFSREVQSVMDALARIGGWSLLAVIAFFALYIAAKLIHRIRLRRLYRLVRIAPGELALLMASDPDMVIVDVRSQVARENDPRRLPASIEVDSLDMIESFLMDIQGRTVVTFCTCPNEASAALLADRLIKLGHPRVRVLTGGTEALSFLSQRAIHGSTL